MKPTVAIIAQGQMGSALAGRLGENGVEVLTCLEGRSEASAARARSAGMVPVAMDDLVRADIILSVVPPNEAAPLAERVAAAASARSQNPVYVDLNATSPETAKALLDVVAGAGCRAVDGSIIGLPPKVGDAGPVLYVSGAEAGRVAVLSQHGLRIRVLDAPLGGASALKMCYGGLTKGLIALGSAMILAAERAGVAEALHAEMAESQSALLQRFGKAIPDMFDKAYRWVPEMNEIASFLGEDHAERLLFEGAAELYERLAEDARGERREIGILSAFLADGSPPARP